MESVYMPVEAVTAYMVWSKTWQCHRLSVTKKLLADPAVRCVRADELASATV